LAETVTGVTLESVFQSLRKILYGTGDTPETDAAIEARARKYIIPMNHNWLNPIKAEGNDTFVEYIIESDDRVVQDSQTYNAVVVPVKKAVVLLRFIGVQGESWVKAFHMLTSRQDVAQIWFQECYARSLDYISAVHCHPIDYFGHNGALAWDMRITLCYTEVYHLDQQPLESVTLAQGIVN